MRHILARLILISLVVGCQSAPKLSAWKKLKKSFSGSSSASSSHYHRLTDPSHDNSEEEEPEEMDLFQAGANILAQTGPLMTPEETEEVQKFMELRELAQNSPGCTIQELTKLDEARVAVGRGHGGDVLPGIVTKIHLNFFQYCSKRLGEQIYEYQSEDGTNWIGIFEKLGSLDKLLMKNTPGFHPTPKIRRAQFTDLESTIKKLGKWQEKERRQANQRVGQRAELVQNFVNNHCGLINQNQNLANIFSAGIAIARYNINFVERIQSERVSDYPAVLAHYILCERIRQNFENN